MIFLSLLSLSYSLPILLPFKNNRRIQQPVPHVSLRLDEGNTEENVSNDIHSFSSSYDKEDAEVDRIWAEIYDKYSLNTEDEEGIKVEVSRSKIEEEEGDSNEEEDGNDVLVDSDLKEEEFLTNDEEAVGCGSWKDLGFSFTVYTEIEHQRVEEMMRKIGKQLPKEAIVVVPKLEEDVVPLNYEGEDDKSIGESEIIKEEEKDMSLGWSKAVFGQCEDEPFSLAESIMTLGRAMHDSMILEDYKKSLYVSDV
jgi:hypothetical protein